MSPTVGFAFWADTLIETSFALPPPLPEPPAHPNDAIRQLSTIANNPFRREKITEGFIANMVGAIEEPKDRP